MKNYFSSLWIADTNLRKTQFIVDDILQNAVHLLPRMGRVTGMNCNDVAFGAKTPNQPLLLPALLNRETSH